jgi:hypothetical protein
MRCEIVTLCDVMLQGGVSKWHSHEEWHATNHQGVLVDQYVLQQVVTHQNCALLQIHDGPGGEEAECGSDSGMASAARAVRRRRPVQLQPAAPTSSATLEAGMGLSTYQADVLFDFFVEHSVNGNPESRQKVLNLLEEKFSSAEEEEGGGTLKRQRAT